MSISLNEILLSIPLYQLTFVTPFPKEEIFYEKVVTSISDEPFELPTLLIIEKREDWIKLNNRKFVNQLIQDSYLYAIVLCNQSNNHLQDDILTLLSECKIPIIQVDSHSLRSDFFQGAKLNFHYGNLSVELDGFFKKGFMSIASNLSMAFGTPLLFLDENKQLLWQTGTSSEREIRKCLQWLQTFQKGDSKDSNQQVVGDTYNTNRITASAKQSFEIYTINIARKVNLSLVSFKNLANWQKKIMDKFIGFTAVLFQTEEVVREQNDRFKEFFIYELLYRKFESKKVLIKQGKTWGWNLEKSHHLLVVNIDLSEEIMDSSDPLDEISFHLETERVRLNETLIIFPFQDQIVVLIEDEENRNPWDRKNIALKTSNWIEEEITRIFPTCLVSIGIGKWYFDTIHLNKSYQEAKIALQFGKVWFENKRIYHMNDLGVLHLLTNIHRDLLHDFCQEYLSILIKSDQEYGTEYLKTLKKYFQYQGVISDVSEAMFIHPNTLRKRLKKIEDMIGLNLQNLEELLNLMVAVKIYYSFSL